MDDIRALREQLLTAANDVEVSVEARVGAFLIAFVLGMSDKARTVCGGCGREMGDAPCDSCGGISCPNASYQSSTASPS
jgi:hypothetical protein